MTEALRKEIEILIRECLVDFELSAKDKCLEDTCKIIDKLSEKYSAKVLAHIKEAGYVQLADNQDTPQHCVRGGCNFDEIRKEGWRKVKLKKQ